LAGFSYLLGFRFSTVLGGIGAVVVAALLGYAFSWINAAIGAKVQNAEMVSMLTMFWLFPLMFASNVFTPTDAMPSWLKAFADNQPISVATDAVRQLSSGADAFESVLMTVVWSVGLVVACGFLAVRSYRRSA
jgi:ABC transporter DrrB family efflux protein